jgi:predicted ester cyclase
MSKQNSQTETNAAPKIEVINSALPVTTRQNAAEELKHPLRVAGYMPDGSYDIVDYIVTSTHQIWDEKFIGKIYDYYHPAAVVHTSNGDIYGRDHVIRLTTIRQGAFPDTRDFIEEVIWDGNLQDGFRTSMRWTYVGTNTGYSMYGAPTGRKVAVRGVANCVIKDNRVVEEWVAYNELSLIRQLGLDENEVMERHARENVSNAFGSDGGKKRAFGEVENVIAQSTPPPIPQPTRDGFDVEYFVRRAYHEIWNWRYLGKIDEYFAENYLCHASSDRELYGLGDYKHDILARLAAFPDTRLQVDEVYYLGNESDGYRVAVRWTVQGTHTGPGIYGMPTGKRVSYFGVSQHLIKNGKFVEEWTEYGEFALMKQLRFG